MPKRLRHMYGARYVHFQAVCRQWPRENVETHRLIVLELFMVVCAPRLQTLPWEDVFLDHHELHRLLVARGKMQHRNIVAFWGISAATVAPKHPVANGSGSHVSASSSAASSLESDGLAPIPHTASWRGEDAVTARRFSRATEVNASQARHSVRA